MCKLIHLLLLCTLLCSCSAKAPDNPPPVTEEATTSTELAHPGYYDPESSLEQQTDGAIRCYPLRDLESTSAVPLGDDLVVFSCTESNTTITLLTGENLVPVASTTVDTVLTASHDSLRVCKDGLTFFEESSQQTVVLDESLKEIRRISAPEDLLGMPMLSADGTALYYCTANGLRAMDLDSGISRCLKEMAYSFQCVKGLWLNDTILECYISSGNSGQTLFLSTETGQLLGSAEENFSFCASDDRYYATMMDSYSRRILYGTAGESIMTLEPYTEILESHFLPESHGLVTVSMRDNALRYLEHYSLTSGFRNSHYALSTDYFPWDFHTNSQGNVCFLNYDPNYRCNVYHQWDISATLTGDDTVYTSTYYTKDAPDQEALAQCAQYAQRIGEKYGVQVLVYKEAAATEPWDYDLEYEHLAGVIHRELTLLDARLANYPQGFLATLADRFDGLTFCIVRSITGSAESGSLDSANGIQFMNGYHAYIALAATANTEYALYHELCHLIDTVVITESGAYDRWEELNPSGFAYDYDYIANLSRNSSAYLQDSSRYFIDNYSMSFPKEDRARIMEYAMTEGNAAYFQSSTMQSKLKLLCEGIREAFGLKKSPETFLWEQYLNISLAYK